MTRPEVGRPRFGLSGLLGVLVAILAVDPLIAPLESGLRVVHLLMAMLVVVAGVMISRDRRSRTVMSVAGVLALIFSVWSSWSGEPIALLADLATLGFLLALGVHVVSIVYSHRIVTRETVNGALSAFLLLGFGFASLYSIADRVSPGAFVGIASAESVTGNPLGMETRGDGLIYFSFVTMTTVGYGEITPRAPSARALANLQAVLAQLFLAVTIARLVGQQVSASSEESNEAGS